MQKREITPQTRLDVPPEINEELLAISDDCLMVQSDTLKRMLRLSFKSVFLLLFCTLPFSLYLASALWLPPYGHNGDSKTFLDMLHNMPAANLVRNLMISIAGGVLPILLTYSYIQVAFIALKKTSPFTFNRKIQTVSAIYNGKKVIIPWLEVKGSSTVNDYGIIKLEGLGQMRGDAGLWEYFCVFMEEGPEGLNIFPYTRDAWDHEPLYSRTFSQAKHHLRIWPINTKPDTHPFASYVIWPYKIVRFIPFLLIEWFWRKLIMRHANKDSICFPEQCFKNCKGERITGKMAAQEVIQADEYINGINYLTLKQRLKEK